MIVRLVYVIKRCWWAIYLFYLFYFICLIIIYLNCVIFVNLWILIFVLLINRLDMIVRLKLSTFEWSNVEIVEFFV